ncbi:transposase [Algoriphagus halophilus]|uniref:transposase n=1 Tax=Algoriphagus halophilus TaxID=226505 RepID=UPI00358E4C50
MRISIASGISKHFNSYIGLKPMVHSSGESDRKGYLDLSPSSGTEKLTDRMCLDHRPTRSGDAESIRGTYCKDIPANGP